LKQHQAVISVDTPGRGPVDVTRAVADALRDASITTGLVVVFCRHTSCSLVIQENADPSARADLMGWLDRIAPDGAGWMSHTAEGPDDMPSHLRAAVTKTSETIPVVDGALALGTWQGLFLLEHRQAPHRRTLVVHVTGA